MGNNVQLITYPNSLGANLKELNQLLTEELQDVFNGIHILPPFPSSGDHGFAPIDYTKIEEAFGSWEDIREIGQKMSITLDLMINHISRKSPMFQDYLQKGQHSEYKDLFLTVEKVFGKDEIEPEQLEKIFLRRSKPYSIYEVAGKPKKIWTTFGKEDPSEQIDFDVNSADFKALMKQIFAIFAQNNVDQIRLDAVGYVIKKAGTSCFFVEPEIDRFLKEIEGQAHNENLELLLEVHAENKIQQKLIEQDYTTYDFILPYRVLEALLLGDNEALCDHLNQISVKQITMLDCHDGIPVIPDVSESLDIEKAKKVRDICLANGGNISPLINASDYELDVHQINGTYFSLLGENEAAYLMARAIHLFAPGIPQIYYVGLLAGSNQPELYEATGDRREINRGTFSLNKARKELKKPVVQGILELIRFRRTHASFNGRFIAEKVSQTELKLCWSDPKTNQTSELLLELDKQTAVMKYSNADNQMVEVKIVS